MNPPQERGSGIDRRTLLRGAAVGTVAAWAAPQLISMPAAAAQSAVCMPDGLAWSDFQIDVDNLPSSSFTAPYAPGGDITVAFSDAGIGGGTASAGYATVAPLGGVYTSLVVLEMDATAVGQYCELSLTFPGPVESLSFTLLDVDLGLGFWQDTVLLEASLGATPVTLGATDYTINTTYLQHDDAPPFPAPKTGDLFTAILDPSGVGDGTDNAATTANVAVTYPGQLDTLVIRYIAGPDEATPQPQQIGVGDLTFCSWP